MSNKDTLLLGARPLLLGVLCFLCFLHGEKMAWLYVEYCSWKPQSDTSALCYTRFLCYHGFAIRCMADEPDPTIIYDTNGDEGDMTMVSHVGVSKGVIITLYAPNYSREGYGFAGWSFDEDAQPTGGDSEIYGPNETVDISFDIEGTSKLYAVWVPSVGNLQGWDGCGDLHNGDVTALTDNRDGNTYAVAKLADGKCWMIENLRLDLAGKNLDSTNTSSPGEEFPTMVKNLPLAVFKPCEESSTDCYDQLSLGLGNLIGGTSAPNGTGQNIRWYSYGAMYNFYTATAGNRANGFNGSICSSKWMLPLYDGFSSLDKVLGGTGEDQNGDDNAEKVSRRWRAYPNNLYTLVTTAILHQVDVALLVAIGQGRKWFWKQS